MFDLNDTGQKAAHDAARKQRRSTKTAAVALIGLSWLAMWIIVNGATNKSGFYVLGAFLLAEVFLTAGWFSIGHAETKSVAVATQVAKAAAIAHATWFVMPVAMIAMGFAALGLPRSSGCLVALAIGGGGVYGAFMVSLRAAGTIAMLSDVSPPENRIADNSESV